MLHLVCRLHHCRLFRLNLPVVYGQREITHFPLRTSDRFGHQYVSYLIKKRGNQNAQCFNTIICVSFTLKVNQVNMASFTLIIQNLVSI